MDHTPEELAKAIMACTNWLNTDVAPFASKIGEQLAKGLAKLGVVLTDTADIIAYRRGYTSARKCIHIENNRRFNLVHEREWTGGTASNICKRYGTSRKTYYKWNNRYKQKGIEGLLDVSKRPHNIKYKKITSEVQETILELRLTKGLDVTG